MAIGNKWGESVVIVADASFGGALKQYACVVPVWVIDSVENRSAVEDCWKLPCDEDVAGGPAITIFTAPVDYLPDAVVGFVLEDVLSHHARCRVLDILGAKLTLGLKSALEAFGFDASDGRLGDMLSIRAVRRRA